MQHPSNGSSGGRNGRRFSPPTEAVPLRAGGRSGRPGNEAPDPRQPPPPPPPPPSGPRPAPAEPRRLSVRPPRREDIGAVAKGARQTWRSVVQVMAMVWQTSRKLTL